MVTRAKLLHRYFLDWVNLYKKGAVRLVTLNKYYGTHRWLNKLAPKLTLAKLNKREYQKLLNAYAETHERQTTMDFHHQVKGAILDAYDEGLLDRDPTRNIVLKGKPTTLKKKKFLSLFELQCLLKELDLTAGENLDWLIYITAKTGLRFSEALGLTAADIDLEDMTIHVNKTWNYKYPVGGFSPTKNISSKRKITLDWKTLMKLHNYARDIPSDQPIFVKKRVYNSTVNSYLADLCKKAKIPIISIHGLRHTHASLLLYSDVSIASVARRLGHSNMTTTQQTYLHIIQELEDKDNEKIISHINLL